MGYRIEYGPVKKVRGLESRFSLICSLVGVIFLACLLLAGCIWSEILSGLRNILIPGDPAITVAAFVELSDQLRNGAPLQDALLSFGADILEGAGIDTVR